MTPKLLRSRRAANLRNDRTAASRILRLRAELCRSLSKWSRKLTRNFAVMSVSLDTTHIYAEVDLQMKAKALASVDITDLPAARMKSPGKADSVMDFMKQL